MKINVLTLSLLFVGMFIPDFSIKAQNNYSDDDIVAEEYVDPDDWHEADGQYYYFYVDANSLNMRKSPSTNAQIVTKLSKYDVVGGFYNSINPNQEWLSLYYFDPVSQEGYEGYVNIKYLKELTAHDYLPKNKLSRSWKLMGNKYEYGMLEFKRDEGDSYTANVCIGEMGPIRFDCLLLEDVSCSYVDGRIYENELPFYYNEKTGILLFYHFLWQEDND